MPSKQSVNINASGLLVAVTMLCGCATTRHPMVSYKMANPADPYALCDLPSILTLPCEPNTANLEEWYRLAKAHRLVGKRIDDAIAVYGDDYLISLYRGRREPRMYYHLAGTHSWGVHGVVVLDANLTVREITLDPAY